MNKPTQGFALVTTLLITAVVGVLVTGSLMLATVNRRISANDSLSTQALNVAQAGTAFWKAELASLYRFMLDNPDLYEDELTAYQADTTNPPIACDNYFAIGLDLNRDGTIETPNAKTATKANPQPLTPDITVPVGGAAGSVRAAFYINGSAVGLRSRSLFSGTRATVVEEFTLNQANIWNNAVFASTTAANATIRGRVAIRGSVHILGEDVAEGDTVLAVSGNSAIGNTYQNLVGSVDGDVTSTANPMRLTNQRPTDLCATLRVKKGKVSIEGSANIGYAEARNTEPYKDNMRGVYTNEGFSGRTNDIYSMNGIDAKYDVGDQYQFPELTDSTKDYDFNVSSNPYPMVDKTWQDKLKDNSLVLALGTVATQDDRRGPHTGNPLSLIGLSRGDTYLDASCLVGSLFGVGTTGTETTFTLKRGSSSSNTTPAFSCRKYRVSGTAPNLTSLGLQDEVVAEVIWSGSNSATVLDRATGATRTINANELYVGGAGGGVMFYGGNLEISGSDKIGYYGDGVLVAEDSNRDATAAATGGNITLEVDFAPASTDTFALDSAPTTGRLKILSSVKNLYPGTALVSMVARNTVDTKDSQIRLATTIYAQERVVVTKQTVVAGSIVSKVFDAGQNVPTILYVSNVSQNLSRLMPGTGGTTFSLSNTAWTRR